MIYGALTTYLREDVEVPMGTKAGKREKLAMAVYALAWLGAISWAAEMLS